MHLKHTILCATLALIGFQTSGQTITGKVSAGGATFTNSYVQLMDIPPAGHAMKVLEEQTLSPDGYYGFTDLPNGQYMVYVKVADDIGYLNTYYGDEHRWDKAAKVTVADNAVLADINLRWRYNWTGPGSCGGTGTIYTVGKVTGDPIPGLDVSLEQVPGGGVKVAAVTDEDGFYFVGSMPLDQPYDVHVEVPGLLYDSTYEVTLTTANPDQLSFDFQVDTTAGAGKIYILDKVTGTRELGNPHNWTKTYPNPVSELVSIEFGIAPEPNMELVIFDANGRLVQTITQVNKNNQIAVGNWDAGLYVYSLLEGHKTAITGRFNVVK